MGKYFYAHIIDPEDLHRELDVLDITSHEKNHLTLILESSLHHQIIDLVLTELPDEHKKSFMLHLANDDNESTWKVVEAGIDNPEAKIRECLESFKQEIAQDILEAHTQSFLPADDE